MLIKPYINTEDGLYFFNINQETIYLEYPSRINIRGGLRCIECVLEHGQTLEIFICLSIETESRISVGIYTRLS